MKWQLVFLLLMGMKWRSVYSTCVFESDFGFTLNCGFKKSSIFRVRNLGGVKSYFGLGFSLGDELGFKESLSNSEGSNRRSAPSGRSAAGYFQPLLTTTPKTENKQIASNRSSHAINIRAPGSRHASVSLMTVPPFRPIHPGDHKLNRPTRITKVRDEDPVTIVAVPAFAALPQSIAKVPTLTNKPDAQTVLQSLLQNGNSAGNSNSNNNGNNRRISFTALNGQRDNDIASNSISQLKVVSPSAPAPPADPLLPEAVGHALKSVAQATNISADALLASIQLRQQQMLYQQQKQLQALAAAATTTTSPKPISTTSTTTLPPPTTPAAFQNSNELTASKNNISKPPKQKYSLTGIHKVMNAPKEYYPVNYDKNFDDNFTSRVELPDTAFSCGDQKHFPGLYADEDLNCMVFHVCALTDDGLVMKSFLCPESTLFDQTILKCNWWFYVDCKASKKLYDSNIPISKSYQLMKALTFFSSYSKNDKSQSS